MGGFWKAVLDTINPIKRLDPRNFLKPTPLLQYALDKAKVSKKKQRLMTTIGIKGAIAYATGGAAAPLLIPDVTELIGGNDQTKQITGSLLGIAATGYQAGMKNGTMDTSAMKTAMMNQSKEKAMSFAVGKVKKVAKNTLGKEVGDMVIDQGMNYMNSKKRKRDNEPISIVDISRSNTTINTDSSNNTTTPIAHPIPNPNKKRVY